MSEPHDVAIAASILNVIAAATSAGMPAEKIAASLLTAALAVDPGVMPSPNGWAGETPAACIAMHSLMIRLGIIGALGWPTTQSQPGGHA